MDVTQGKPYEGFDHSHIVNLKDMYVQPLSGIILDNKKEGEPRIDDLRCVICYQFPNIRTFNARIYSCPRCEKLMCSECYEMLHSKLGYKFEVRGLKRA